MAPPTTTVVATEPGANDTAPRCVNAGLGSATSTTPPAGRRTSRVEFIPRQAMVPSWARSPSLQVVPASSGVTLPVSGSNLQLGVPPMSNRM